jgi:hypothetical protein
VFLALGMVVLAMVLCGSTVRFSRILMMFRGLIMLILGHLDYSVIFSGKLRAT